MIGHAEVRQTYKASGVGTIAGSYVLDGTIQRNCKVRISREGEQIFEGELASLKRFKDDVKEVNSGYECGMSFEKYNDIKEGDQITKEMVTTVEAGGYNLPGNVVYLEEDVIGKYANTDLYPGDSILTSKLSDTPMLKNAYLSKLNGENRAISISIKSFAAGLSGKLEAGDIVTLIASDVGENRETLVPPELQYVEIIATTTSTGADQNVQEETEDGEEQELASAITVLATQEQATLLAELEQTGSIHAALVFRGDSTTAKKFLDEQNKVLEELLAKEAAETEQEAGAEEEIVNDDPGEM